MKKYTTVALIILIIILIVCLCACMSDRPTKDKPVLGNNFAIVAEEHIRSGYVSYYLVVFVDIDTRVMYLYSVDTGITPLYNKDGSLKIYRGVLPQH